MQEEEDKPAVVIDNGSGLCKAGLAGEDIPGAVFPTLVGRPKHGASKVGGAGECYVGGEAENRRDVLELSRPVTKGVITNWEDMERVWRHAYSLLGVAPPDQPVLLSEAPDSTQNNREKMAQVMFESLHVPALLVASQAILVHYAAGRVIALVVDVGCDVTHVVPFYEGYAVPEAMCRANLAGSHVTAYLASLLQKKGYDFTSQPGVVQDIKEKICHVTYDVTAKPEEKSYKLPDGSTITVGNEAFQAPECLFQPALVGEGCAGLHDLISESLKKCEMDVRKDLYPNIILAGGSTMFPGMKERLQKELESLVPPRAKLKVIAHPERRFSAWIGGSILTSLSATKNLWITKQEYEDAGPNIMHKKALSIVSVTQ